MLMNWDWDKLQERKRSQGRGSSPGGGDSGGGPQKPDFDQIAESLKRFRNRNFPAGKLVVGIIIVLWLLSGIYIVEPAEVGVVLRFGEYNRTTESGPHYHFPYPIESVQTPKVTEVRRVEIGFRSMDRSGSIRQAQMRLVPEESLMLTGDENIVDVQFIVQYRIKDPEDFLFNVNDQHGTVKNASEAAMREVIGDNKIDTVLTGGKAEIQNETRDLLQEILDRYTAGILVTAVQLQDVHPPKEVVDAFKDVASAREDKVRFINEADAYRNDLIPRARGLAAQNVNQALAYKESKIRQAKGDADRFLAVLKEYNKAKDITRTRLYLETMESIYSNPNLEKIILGENVAERILPLLPLNPGGTSAPIVESPAKTIKEANQ
jgi:modulator of FtsH protease HflK